MPQKKAKPVISWKLDVDFYSAEITVKARTKGEARKKAMAKLKRQSASMYINRRNTYLDKDY